MTITTIESWTKSAKNNDISLAYGGGFSFAKNKRPILLIGGVHGDEPEGVQLARDLLSSLETEDVSNCPWVLIPCLNPDGYFAQKRTNGRGVDLNRNYPASNWSTEYKNERYFPGNLPNSEPEIIALVDLIEGESPRLIIHFHSWKPCIVYAGGKGINDARRLSDLSKYELLDDIGYPTPGSLSSYAWGDLKIPVICIEEQEGCPLDLVWSHFGSALLEILKDDSERQ